MVFDEEIEKRHRIRSNVRYVGHCPLRQTLSVTGNATTKYILQFFLQKLLFLKNTTDNRYQAFHRRLHRLNWASI